jgi:hypothetical protein
MPKKKFDASPYASLLSAAEAAFLEDVQIVLRIARAAGQVADRRGLIETDRNGDPREQPIRPTTAAGRPTTTGTCPPDHAHGKSSHCYSAHRCRCDECKSARAAQTRLAKRKRLS